jgi:diacylglycerol kinase (ATP)
MTPPIEPLILFVINPFAGANRDADLPASINTCAQLNALNFKLFVMTGADDLKAIEEAIVQYKPDILAAAGGDGTCNLVAQCARSRHLKMGIIPIGSANGMAVELNIPREMNEAILNLVNGVPKKIDLLQINESDIALHLSDVGLNAKIVKRFHVENRRGLWRYVVHFFTEYFLLKHYRFIITCDGKTFMRKAISITFANASKYGTGAVINPKGIIDDGKFELCIIKPFPWYYLLPITIKFFRGNLTNSKYVEIISCAEAIIDCRKKLILQIDGEIKKKTHRIMVGILPKALDVIVPVGSKI